VTTVAPLPKPLDVIIAMGWGDACPVFPGKRYEDWQLDDPAGQGIDAVRPIATRSRPASRSSSPNCR
jgi:protein-tyrosine-phosphatase